MKWTAGLALLAAVGCRRADAPAPESTGISVQVAVTPEQVALGEPIVVTYTWTLAERARLPPAGYIPFVHFVDRDTVTLFADDYEPRPPVPTWQAGRSYTYTSRLFTPVVPYAGPVDVLVGLYPETEAGERFPLDGVEHRWREYRVGGFQLLPRDRDLTVRFEDGFHPPESSAPAPFAPRRWMRRSGRLTFPRPDEDLVLLLVADTGGVSLPEPPVLTVRSTTEAVARLPLDGQSAVRAAIDLPRALLGEETTIALGLEVTGGPPAGAGGEERGLRVFHLCLTRASRLVPAQRDGLLRVSLTPAEGQS